MEYIVCFKTKDIEQFKVIKDARYAAFELTDEIKKLDKDSIFYKTLLSKLIEE